MKKLIIFDFDGVLVDTEWNTFIYYQNYLKKYHNIVLSDDDFKFKRGEKSDDFFRNVLTEEQQKKVDTVALTEQKREEFSKNPKQYAVLSDGVVDLLKMFKNVGYILAIGSQNEKFMIESTIQHYNIASYFSLVLSMQDIQFKKPNPKVFRMCLDKFSVDSTDAVVIEDSPKGIEGANSIGIGTIGITTSNSREKLSSASVIVDKLNEITVDVIEKI